MITDCARYVAGVRVVAPMSFDDAGRLAGQTEGFVWVALSDPAADELAELAAAFGLQRLASNANLARVTVRQNVTIQQVSAWAAIAAAATIITGIYGMNFRHMPELGWVFGYPMAIAVIILTVVLLRWYFRREGWL